MLDKILEKGKLVWEETSKKVLGELQVEFEKFLQEYVDEANRQKITLEHEIKNLEVKKKEMQELSDKVVFLNETIKKEEETIKKYEIKQNELLGEILEIEAREKKVGEEEKYLSEKNTELYNKEQNLLIENKILDEKQRNLKKIYDKLNT